MQWTSAEMVECDAQSIAAALYFMFLVCAPTMEMYGVKFCDQDTGTNLHTQESNERFSTSQRSSCSPVLFGAICHLLLFVTFSLAPNLSLPELVLVRTYTL